MSLPVLTISQKQELLQQICDQYGLRVVPARPTPEWIANMINLGWNGALSPDILISDVISCIPAGLIEGEPQTSLEVGDAISKLIDRAKFIKSRFGGDMGVSVRDDSVVIFGDDWSQTEMHIKCEADDVEGVVEVAGNLVNLLTEVSTLGEDC
jgi:hypothetical protein